MSVSSRWLLVLFCASLAWPLVDRRLRPQQWEHVRAELRDPEPWPQAPTGLYSAQRYPARLERWHSDALGSRDRLIWLSNLQSVALFGKAPSAFHVRGRDGFLFFAGQDSQAIWRGRKPLDAEHLEAWCKAIEERRKALELEGIRYWFCVAPNKESIYPERLPDGEERCGVTPLIQLDAALRERGEPAWFDLRPALLAEKSNDRPELDDWTYLRLGTHYSYRGGASVALALAEHGRSAGLPFALIPRGSWESFQNGPQAIEDCLPLLWHLEDWDHEPDWRVRPSAAAAVEVKEPDNSALRQLKAWEGPAGAPRVMLLHDSFGNWTTGALAEYCSTLHACWQYQVSVPEIAAMQPDLVIQVVTERHLRNQPERMEAISRLLTLEQFEGLGSFSAGIPWQERLRPHLDTQLIREGDVIAIDCAVGADKFYLDTPVWEPSHHAVLRIGLTASTGGRMYIWYRERTDPGYQKGRRVVVPVIAGQQEICVELPGETLPGELMVQPINAAARIVLHAVELRPLRSQQD